MKASDAISIEGKIKFESKHVPHADGAIIIEGMHIADTVQCCHCGKHWIPIYGSGRVRGWCTKCNKPTCGSAECMECVSFEQKLDDFEKGRIITL